VLVKRWRKQLRTSFGSTRWQSLPVFTRALARELQMFADDSGLISLPEDGRPGCLWRIIGAHGHERQTLAKHLGVLLDRGTCEWSTDGLVFPKFPAYQADAKAKRGASADEVLAKRGASADEVLAKRGASADEVLAKRGASANEAKLLKSHEPKPIEEEREGEGERSANALPAARAQGPSLEDLAATLHRAFATRFAEHAPSVVLPQVLRDGGVWHPTWQKLAALIVEQSGAEGSSIGVVATRVTERFFAHDLAAQNKWPPGMAVKAFARYADPAPEPAT
jgi:hypothetical protein